MNATKENFRKKWKHEFLFCLFVKNTGFMVSSQQMWCTWCPVFLMSRIGIDVSLVGVILELNNSFLLYESRRTSSSEFSPIFGCLLRDQPDNVFVEVKNIFLGLHSFMCRYDFKTEISSFQPSFHLFPLILSQLRLIFKI